MGPFDMSPSVTISATRLMELLTPTLGWDKSSDVVSTALTQRGLSPGALSVDDAMSLLEALATESGMVGIAARYAATRIKAMRGSAPPSTSSSGPPSPPSASRASSSTIRPSTAGTTVPPSFGLPPTSAPPSSAAASTLRSASDPLSPPASGEVASARARATTVELREIVDLFEGAMGRAKSEEVVGAAARRLGLPTERLEKAHALALVDSLAGEPGMVGLCARFAKARLILRFAA